MCTSHWNCGDECRITLIVHNPKMRGSMPGPDMSFKPQRHQKIMAVSPDPAQNWVISTIRREALRRVSEQWKMRKL
jgi:hypothetical protein